MGWTAMRQMVALGMTVFALAQASPLLAQDVTHSDEPAIAKAALEFAMDELEREWGHVSRADSLPLFVSPRLLLTVEQYVKHQTPEGVTWARVQAIARETGAQMSRLDNGLRCDGAPKIWFCAFDILEPGLTMYSVAVRELDGDPHVVFQIGVCTDVAARACGNDGYLWDLRVERAEEGWQVAEVRAFNKTHPRGTVRRK